MGLYQAYRGDAKAETDGIWFTFEGGFKLRIARAGGSNTEYLSILAEMAEKLQDSDNSLMNNRALAEVYTKAIIKGAEGDGFVTAEGAPIAVGTDDVTNALVELPEFFQEVIGRATNRRFYLASGADPAKR